MVGVVDVSAGCDDIVEVVEEAETQLAKDVVDGMEIVAVTLVDITGWEVGAPGVVVTTPPVPIVATTVAVVLTTVVVGAAIVAVTAVGATVDGLVDLAVVEVSYNGCLALTLALLLGIFSGIGCDTVVGGNITVTCLLTSATVFRRLTDLNVDL